MRLVSAVYGGYYPFDRFNFFNDFESSDDPGVLTKDDSLVVWGGGDIHPSLYNKKKSSRTGAGETPSQRDKIEWAFMQRAIELGIPIIGVCRGGQMLCAAAGGYLIQHVDNHAGNGHLVVTADGINFGVNTIHHQMMMPANSAHEMVAWTPQKLSGRYFDEDNLVDVEREPEFIYFKDINGYAIQWHPEGMRVESDATQYIKAFMQRKDGRFSQI